MWVTLDRELVKGGTSRKKGRNRIEKTKEGGEKRNHKPKKTPPSNPGYTLCGRKKKNSRLSKKMDVRFLLQVEKLQLSRYVHADKFML